MRVGNGFGPQRCCKEAAARRGSHPSRVRVGLVSAIGDLWDSRRC
jgi:hypothetical protein